MATLFEGVTEAAAALERISLEIETAARLAVTDAAHYIERGAKGLAPVKTGTLRRSIAVFGPNRLGAGIYEAYVGPTVVYGRRVELGFVGTDSLGRSYNQQPRPYLQPAFDAAVAGPITAIFQARMGALSGGR